MKVLAIETSCDDTSLAVVSFSGSWFVCEEMVAFHQIDLHESYGGVVPELASREHLNQIIPVLYDLCYRMTDGYDLDKMMLTIDKIVVTQTPWLPGSLIIGRTAALLLSERYQKPCQFVNHLHGHIVSWFLGRIDIDTSKSLILSVSWWHSDLSMLSLVDSNDLWDYVDIDNISWKYTVEKKASTRDDAIGEVFDKISRLLWWPYPWGVRISEQAEKNHKEKTQRQYPFVVEKFKRILLKDTYDFSFSGMKSQAYNFITKYKKELHLSEQEQLPSEIISYLAFEFQEAAADILTKRVVEIIYNENINTVALVWWVSANTRIREKIQIALDKHNQDTGQKVRFFTPLQFDYCTDNAAMIGVAGMLSIETI